MKIWKVSITLYLKLYMSYLPDTDTYEKQSHFREEICLHADQKNRVSSL